MQKTCSGHFVATVQESLVAMDIHHWAPRRQQFSDERAANVGGEPPHHFLLSFSPPATAIMY